MNQEYVLEFDISIPEESIAEYLGTEYGSRMRAFDEMERRINLNYRRNVSSARMQRDCRIQQIQASFRTAVIQSQGNYSSDYVQTVRDMEFDSGIENRILDMWRDQVMIEFQRAARIFEIDINFVIESFEKNVMEMIQEKNQEHDRVMNMRTMENAVRGQALRQIAIRSAVVCVLGNSECQICMDEIIVGSEVYDIPCGHHFHTPCLTKWRVEKNTCPSCRNTIV